MKLLIVACALVAVVLADWTVKSSEEVSTIRKTCMKENPVPADLLEKMKSWNYPNEEPVRKYMICVGRKMNVWDSENGFNLERMVLQFKSDLNEDEVSGILKKCIDDNKKSGAAEDWLIPTQQCIIESKIGDKIKSYIEKQKHNH